MKCSERKVYNVIYGNTSDNEIELKAYDLLKIALRLELRKTKAIKELMEMQNELEIEKPAI